MHVDEDKTGRDGDELTVMFRGAGVVRIGMRGGGNDRQCHAGHAGRARTSLGYELKHAESRQFYSRRTDRQVRTSSCAEGPSMKRRKGERLRESSTECAADRLN